MPPTTGPWLNIYRLISAHVMRRLHVVPAIMALMAAAPSVVSALVASARGGNVVRRIASRSHVLTTRRSSRCFSEESRVSALRFSASTDGTTRPRVSMASSSAPHAFSEDDSREKIVLWRGESAAGYSFQFRHRELTNSIAAAFGLSDVPTLSYNGMLKYDGERELSERELKGIEGAMEFISNADGSPISKQWLIQATERTSLMRECYEVVAKADTYDELARLALESGALDDVLSGGENQDATWKLRLRQYGSTSTNDKGRRYGKNARSPIRAEKQAIQAMADLFIRFKGKVDLINADCGLYVLQGTKEKKMVLARTIAKGPKISTIAPKTRVCITNTPLESIAAYNLCNFSWVSDGQTVLDTYAGSCATLLAAASVAPNCSTVGIEIALKKFIKKEDIIEDFASRNLKVPNAIIRGDSMHRDIRDRARKAIGDKPFDCIVTDPPCKYIGSRAHHSLLPCPHACFAHIYFPVQSLYSLTYRWCPRKGGG